MGRHLRSERGVTLVELMVVVAIIAIIAAIAVTIFQDLQKKAKLGADQGSVGAMRSAVALYYGKTNGLFPASETNVENLTTPLPSWNCASPTYDSTNGKVTYSGTIATCP
jgi:prepilin-type N-terminal cleavage/methylation domain-containing protein